jgi:hypothetical protein
VVVHVGGNEVLPRRVGEMLCRISATITDRGNEMVYHDWEELYSVSSSSATAFPDQLRRFFTATVVDRGYSILFRNPDEYRTTKIPTDFAELSVPVMMRGFYTTMRAYQGRRHVALIPSKVEKNARIITLTEKGVTTEFTVIPITSGTPLKAYLYCLLTSFMQPSLYSRPDVKIEAIKASLKEKYPEQYARFVELG